MTTAERLELWLDASKTLPPPSRAAALLLADYYVTCHEDTIPVAMYDRYASIGVRLGRDDYTHSLRDEAKNINARGDAGEWAALHAFWDKCTIAYATASESGESLAKRLSQRFPEWRPYISYALGRVPFGCTGE